jgi:hypothetical protein
VTIGRATLGFLLFGAAVGAGVAWEEKRGGSAAALSTPAALVDSGGVATGDATAGLAEILRGRRVVVEFFGDVRHADGEGLLLRELDGRVEAMAADLGITAPDKPLQVRYYADAETKGRVTGNVHHEHADPDGNTIHRVLDPADPAGDGLSEADLLLRRAFGTSRSDWLSAGASVWLAGEWLGVPLAEWPGRLAGMGVRLDPARVTRDFEGDSYFFSWPAAGDLVSRIVERNGVRELRALFERSRTDSALAGFDAAAFPAETALAKRSAEGMPRAAGGRPAPATGPPRFLRGICYAHQYSLDHGYLSSSAGLQNLRYLRDSVHAGAVSVSPFGYIESATSPVIHHRYRVRGGGHEAHENDESLVAVTRNAHSLGMTVVLAPHLWGRRVWCGEWHAETEADWGRLFDEYSRFILHYAAVAEYAGCDMLQVGKELGGTTHREREWRELIGRVRKIYTGPIVYGANWDSEYGAIAWWDAVDYIGVSQYTPLAHGDSPTDGELEAGARAVADSLDALARRFGRPYILTEAGFTAHSDAARSPWLSFDARSGTPDLALQARCYEAVLGTFAGRPSCAGIFWWKWFSRLESNNAGRNEYDFPPYGKPAEAVLAKWYGRLEERAGVGGGR